MDASPYGRQRMGMGPMRPRKDMKERIFDFGTVGGIILGLFFLFWGLITAYQVATETIWEWAYPMTYMGGSLSSMTWLGWLGIDLFASDATAWLVLLAPMVWGGGMAFVLWKVRQGSDWADRTFQVLTGLLFLFSIFGAYQTSKMLGEAGEFAGFLEAVGFTWVFPAVIAVIAFVWYALLIGFPFGGWQGVLDIEYFLKRNTYAKPMAPYQKVRHPAMRHRPPRPPRRRY